MIIFPIFIPINNPDPESNKHGYGCKCPECVRREKNENMPKQYYKYRYAIPYKFIVKNQLTRMLFYIIAIFGLCIMCSPLIISFNMWIQLLCILVGIGICTASYIIGDMFIKYNFECKDKIYIELNNYNPTSDDWENKIKSMGIPKGYILTKEKSDWRYK